MKTYQRGRLGSKNLFLAFSMLFICINWSCKKENVTVLKDYSELEVCIEYSVSGTPLIFDSLIYKNKAGEFYSVSNLEFFLSNLTLLNDVGNVILDNVDYLNASSSKFQSTSTIKVPFGHYKGIRLLIGLDSIHNVTGRIPHTIENENMAWPVPMGGGYHFMKFEGRFYDSGNISGYAIHLGRNVNLVKIEIPVNFDITYSNHKMFLTMNINEWFENPWMYSLSNDGNYTMNSLPMMKKISENGSDVLQFKLLE